MNPSISPQSTNCKAKVSPIPESEPPPQQILSRHSIFEDLHKEVASLYLAKKEDPQSVVPRLGSVEFLNAGGLMSVEAAQSMLEGLACGYYGGSESEWRKMALPDISVATLDYKPYDFENNFRGTGAFIHYEPPERLVDTLNLPSKEDDPHCHISTTNPGYGYFGESSDIWMSGITKIDRSLGTRSQETDCMARLRQ